MEIKLYVPDHPMGQKRNQERNLKISETNENENTTHQNLWDVEKAVLRGNFIAISAYIKKKGRSHTNNLTLYLME